MPPTTSFSQEAKTTTRMCSRQRPLHACGVSMLTIGDIAIGKTQNINGPIGSTFKNMATLAKFITPLIYTIQYQWLTFLAFIDDRILAAENITEKLFPPSSYVFDKIDEIVLMILSLPDKFDGVLNKNVPEIIQKVPFLEWMLKVVTSKMNSLVSTLRRENSSVDEKTIDVDISFCNNDSREMESGASEEYLEFPMDPSSVDSFPPIPEAENKSNVAVSCANNKKSSYKEVLLESNEKKIDNDECEDEDEGKEKKIEECESDEKIQGERNESVKYEYEYDPLMDLFESAWLMSPRRYGNQAQAQKDSFK
ncbi:uncharacterized protein LOC131603505 [Vicia villosa]|uniref:uncharacterized protein LOC131603505 n=1 Tax=Vicia villosa TaxID=3911 RepID=UPI00273B6AD5|nr:uncharacterized protein LOC131603505 [Vicia villosa]